MSDIVKYKGCYLSEKALKVSDTKLEFVRIAS